MFCRQTKKNIVNLIDLFCSYGEVLGQLIGPKKCQFFHGSLSTQRLRVIKYMLGFSMVSLPFIYLGVPLFLGKPRVCHFRPFVGRLKAKLHSWKGSMLSVMGRIQLVKSVINGMLLYSFNIYLWPRSLLKEIGRYTRNFIWTNDITRQKLVTMSWNRKLGNVVRVINTCISFLYHLK